MYTVTMRNSTTDENGTVWDFEAVDYVSADELNAYVADAETRWSVVDVTLENQEN